MPALGCSAVEGPWTSCPQGFETPDSLVAGTWALAVQKSTAPDQTRRRWEESAQLSFSLEVAFHRTSRVARGKGAASLQQDSICRGLAEGRSLALPGRRGQAGGVWGEGKAGPGRGGSSQCTTGTAGCEQRFQVAQELSPSCVHLLQAPCPQSRDY